MQSIPTILNETNNLKLYPNPTTTTINLSFDNPNDISAIQVYDMLGRLVFEDANSQPQNFSNESVNIKLPFLQDGVYSLRVLGSKSAECKQFVVKH